MNRKNTFLHPSFVLSTLALAASFSIACGPAATDYETDPVHATAAAQGASSASPAAGEERAPEPSIDSHDIAEENGETTPHVRPTRPTPFNQ